MGARLLIGVSLNDIRLGYQRRFTLDIQFLELPLGSFQKCL